MRYHPTPMWHRAFAPATVANLGPGYDILGLALDPALGLGDTCEVRLNDSDKITLHIEGDGGRLPTNPARNCASVAAQTVLTLAQSPRPTGLDIRLKKGLPLGSGLGSSAASAASAALATNAALGSPLTRLQLVEAGRAGERVAAGSPHPDNVAPSLMGGILLMVERPGGLQIVSLPIPDDLRLAVVIPDLKVRTADARAVLPAQVPLGDAVANAASIALCISALYDDDLSRLSLAIEDRLHQPYRKHLVRGYEAAYTAAMAAGALGAGLSGSGPAMFALTDGDDSADACGRAFVAAFAQNDVSARYVAARVAPPATDDT